jgi:hypothetical protein
MPAYTAGASQQHANCPNTLNKQVYNVVLQFVYFHKKQRNKNKSVGRGLKIHSELYFSYMVLWKALKQYRVTSFYNTCHTA